MYFVANSSAELSASAQVTTRFSYFCGFELNPPATGTATLKVYDSSSATTTIPLLTATIAAGTNTLAVPLTIPKVANKGIYAVLSGVATTYTIAYSLG